MTTKKFENLKEGTRIVATPFPGEYITLLYYK